MRKNKGFTLVELMAILVILAAMMLISAPSITKTLKKSQDLESIEYEKNLCLAAQSYMQIEKRDVDLSTPQTISIETLMSTGYVTDDTVNPSTDKVDMSIEIRKQDGEIKCVIK